MADAKKQGDTQRPAEVDADALDAIEEQSEPALAKDRKDVAPAHPAPAPDRKA